MGQDLQDLSPQIEIQEPFHDLSKLSSGVICQAWIVLLPLKFEGHIYCIPVVENSGMWLSHEIMLCTIVIRNKTHQLPLKEMKNIQESLHWVLFFFFFFPFATIISLKNKKQWQKQHRSGIPKAQDFWTTLKTQACQHVGQRSPSNSCQNS